MSTRGRLLPPKRLVEALNNTAAAAEGAPAETSRQAWSHRFKFVFE